MVLKTSHPPKTLFFRAILYSLPTKVILDCMRSIKPGLIESCWFLRGLIAQMHRLGRSNWCRGIPLYWIEGEGVPVSVLGMLYPLILISRNNVLLLCIGVSCWNGCYGCFLPSWRFYSYLVEESTDNFIWPPISVNSENFFRLNPAIRIEFYFRTHNLNKLKRDKQEINNEKNDERTILVAPRPRLENGGSLRLPVELSGKLSQAPARYRTEPCLFRSAGWDLHDCLFYLH